MTKQEPTATYNRGLSTENHLHKAYECLRNDACIFDRAFFIDAVRDLKKSDAEKFRNVNIKDPQGLQPLRIFVKFYFEPRSASFAASAV